MAVSRRTLKPLYYYYILEHFNDDPAFILEHVSSSHLLTSATENCFANQL